MTDTKTIQKEIASLFSKRLNGVSVIEEWNVAKDRTDNFVRWIFGRSQRNATEKSCV